MTSSAAARSVNGTVRPGPLGTDPAISLKQNEDRRGGAATGPWSYLVVRSRGSGQRAHGIRVVRGVQEMLDFGRHGVIEFGHIRFVARDHVVTYVFREDEFVGCCVAHH